MPQPAAPSPRPRLGGGGEPCTLCAKTVYSAERMATASGRVYHKTCFVCTRCSRKLTSASACEDAVTGRLYCEPHYSQLAKAASLTNLAKGGVDESAGVLVEKRKKKLATEEEEDAEVGEGSLVWVEVTAADVRQALIPHHATDEPYALAEVTAVLADSFMVRRRGGGSEVEVAARLVCAADDAEAREAESVSNNLRLPRLNEPSLLHNIRRRFETGKIYTHTGQLELLALNPYEVLPGLYGEDAMRRVAATADAQHLEPHTYAVGEAIYRGLAQSGGATHSVIVSGESGAGKTEANKQ